MYNMFSIKENNNNSNSNSNNNNHNNPSKGNSSLSSMKKSKIKGKIPSEKNNSNRSSMSSSSSSKCCEGGSSTPIRKNVATGLRRRLRKSLRNDRMESYASEWEIEDILFHRCHVDNIMEQEDDDNNNNNNNNNMTLKGKKQEQQSQSSNSSHSNASTENLTDDEDDDELFIDPPVLLVRATPDSDCSDVDPITVDALHKDDNDSSSSSSFRRQLFAPANAVTNKDNDNNRTHSSQQQQQQEVNLKDKTKEDNKFSFAAFRINYLIVYLAIMLADGLQGTHLYVLYEGYGYSVASLYCLGFVSGAVTSPFIGPLVDRMGRKKAAMLYCFLEMVINYLEQFPLFAGLIVSRIVGGITTNLLYSVFESWLVTEHRKRGFDDEQLETILCDSVIASNLAAIFSGYLSHVLASKYGAVGPFEGAVLCTAIALVLVGTMWAENYGSENDQDLTFRQHMVGAFHTIVGDSKISRIGLIQGLTEGTLQTFVFLWSPAMRSFATTAAKNNNDTTIVLGMDDDGQPAYGLIFSAFMACGVIGGLSESTLRKFVAGLSGAKTNNNSNSTTNKEMKEEDGRNKYEGVEFLTAMCYFASAGLLLLPYVLARIEHEHSFSISLGAFLAYEFLVGVYMPCEGVIRSIYMPNESICSLMTMLRVIVNVAVALGVISTNYIDFTTAFLSISCMVAIAGVLQLSLVSKEQWYLLFRIQNDETTVLLTNSCHTTSNTITTTATTIDNNKIQEPKKMMMPSIPSVDDGRNLPGRTTSEVSCF